MSSVATLRDIAQLPEDAPLRQSKFWNKPAESITPEQIIAFVKRMEMRGQGDAARDNIQVLLDMIRKDIAGGQIDAAVLESFKLKEKTLSIEQMRRELNGLTHDRREAVIFAIASKLTLDEVTLLKWSDVSLTHLDTRARELVRYRPRHIQTNLVFWEYVNGKLVPLLGLSDQLAIVTDKTLYDFQSSLENVDNAMSDNDYWLMRRALWKALL